MKELNDVNKIIYGKSFNNLLKLKYFFVNLSYKLQLLKVKGLMRGSIKFTKPEFKNKENNN